jgi:Ca2+/Na+ antiporter
MYRSLIVGGVAFVTLIFAAQRQLRPALKDIERYNTMREMSGDLPLLGQALEVLGNLLKAYATSRPDKGRSLFKSVQYDLIRYIRMATM